MPAVVARAEEARAGVARAVAAEVGVARAAVALAGAAWAMAVGVTSSSWLRWPRC